MIHLGDNRAANEADILLMLPEHDVRGKRTAAVYFADGSVAHTSVLALTIRKRLEACGETLAETLAQSDGTCKKNG